MPTYTPPASSGGGGGGGGSYADSDAIAAVEGESTLVLSSGVTVGTDLKLSTSSDHAIIENVTQDKDIIFHVNDGGSAGTEVMRIDGSLAKVGIGTGDAISANLHVQGTGTSDTAPVLMVESTDSGSATAPDLVLYRNSSNAADADALGHVLFRGKNDNASPQDVTYAQIYAKAQDVSDETEDGQLFLRTIVNGTLTNKIECNSTEVVVNNGSVDNDFRVESDNDTHVLFIEGSTDRVAVGTDDPQGKFHVRNSATNEYTALFENTDDDASAAPDVALYRNSLTPANGDDLGHLIWRGTTDDGDGTITRANITDIFSELQVANTGAESGKMHLRTKMAGTMKKRLTIAATETILNEDAQNADFRVESTGNQSMLRVDASTDRVGIGLAAPAATLDILDGGTFRNTHLLTVSDSTASLDLTEPLHAGRYVIYSGTGGTLNLPTTSTAGEHYAILNITGGNVTISRNGNSINGAASDFTLGTFKAATCIAIGSNSWMVVG
tara:strand:- start:672 stop:2165 length:1494 start_codon:yes stop_codon:yes gene_type:complete